MAQLLSFPALPQVRSTSSDWDALRKKHSGGGRHLCFFTDGRKQDQARKALEGALGGKKTEFDKWNKEIEKRNAGGGGKSGNGGWFGGGGGGWFGWFNDENFRNEAKQAALTVGALLSLYILLSKGGVMFAIASNSLLFVLRGIRTQAELVLSLLPGRVFNAPSSPPSSFSATAQSQPSAKERVVSKWATD